MDAIVSNILCVHLTDVETILVRDHARYYVVESSSIDISNVPKMNWTCKWILPASKKLKTEDPPKKFDVESLCIFFFYFTNKFGVESFCIETYSLQNIDSIVKKCIV